MLDVIGGIRVSPIEYLLMGAALVLFFVLLLALAGVMYATRRIDWGARGGEAAAA